MAFSTDSEPTNRSPGSITIMRQQQPDFRRFSSIASGLIAISLGAAAGVAVADTPDSSCHWRRCATVEQPVTHSVMLQDRFSGELRRRKLVGPAGLVVPAAGDGCLCCYQFEPEPAEAPAGRLELTLPGQPEAIVVVVGPPRAALLPAQILRDGPPAGEAGTVVFEERPILAIERGKIGRLAAVCLPVEYRHHFERLRPTAAAAGFVVHAEVEPAAAESCGVVDDLGTNQIGLDRSRQAITRLSAFTIMR